VTASKFGELVNISGPSLLGIFSHPNLEHDSSVILDFLTEWMKYASEEDKKMFPTFINTINFEKVPKEWFTKALTIMSNPNPMNTSTNENMTRSIMKLEHKIIGANGMKTEEHSFYLFPEFEKNEVLSNQNENKELPFKIYTCDTEDNKAHINVYTIKSAYSNVLKLERSSLYNVDTRNKSCNMIHFCKSFSVDKLLYKMIGTSSGELRTRYSLNNYALQIHPYVHQDFQKLRALSSSPYPYSIQLQAQYLELAMATCGIYIFIYLPKTQNDETSAFRLFNCEINEWAPIRILGKELIRTMNPILLSITIVYI